MKIKNRSEYLKFDEPYVMVNPIKIIDMDTLLMQLSKVIGFCYSKIKNKELKKEK